MTRSRSRLRLIVVQIMVLSLFGTLLARLWYIQVVGGDVYQAAAQDNTVRDIEIPAPRGLIVDAEGRPLVANRTSWVVTVDRDVLDRLGGTARRAVLTRLADTLGLSERELVRRTKTCGEPGAAKAPLCWNGSPYEPVPVAEDVPQTLAGSISRAVRGLPGRGGGGTQGARLPCTVRCQRRAPPRLQLADHQERAGCRLGRRRHQRESTVRGRTIGASRPRTTVT